MPTIIDALVVTLGLDGSKYFAESAKARDDSKKTATEATKQAKDFEAQQRKTRESMVAVRNEIVGLFAAFTAGAGLKDFVLSTITADAATGRLAHNLGVATESLSAWEGAVKRVGGTSQDADSSLQALATAYQRITLYGDQSLAPVINALGISFKDLKNPTDGLLKIADAFQKIDPARAQAMGQALGLSPATINLLERGRTAVQAMLDEQKRLGVVTAANTASSQRLQDALARLSATSADMGRQLLTDATPALEAFGNWMVRVGEWAKQNQDVVRGAFIGMAVGATALGIALAPAIAGFVALAAGAAAVGAGIGYLVQRYPEVGAAFGELGKSAGELFDALKPIGAAFADLFGAKNGDLVRTFVNLTVNALHVLSDAVRVVAALLRGDLKGAMDAARDFGRDVLTNPIADKPGRPSAGAPAAAPAATSATATQAAPTGSAPVQALALIRQREGYQATGKWDRNAYRAGFGSDTHTDARTGAVTRVRQGETVNRDDAEADLQRRVTTEFMPRVAAAVGAAWSKLTDGAKAALTSVAYNYGSLSAPALRGVLAAARSGDQNALADAVLVRRGDNKGINAQRRIAESGIIRSTGVAQQLARAEPGVRRTVTVTTVTARRAPTPTPTPAPLRTARTPTPATAPLRTARAPTAPAPRAGAQLAVASARAAAPVSASRPNVANTTTIGELHVHTAATDGAGVARDLRADLQRRGIVTAANTGLS